MCIRENALSCLRAYARDDRGSAALEFVMSIPIMVGIMAITAEYGRSLIIREALDSAVSDATRLLARAPFDEENASRVDGVLQWTPYQAFVDDARELIADRVFMEPDEVTINFDVVIEDPGENFRVPYQTITMTVDIQVNLPLLSYTAVLGQSDPNFDNTITFRSTEQARYAYEAPSLTEECNVVQIVNGECSI